jgi:hypothetical protein
MEQTAMVIRYRREHSTRFETTVARRLKQRVGEPCNGGAAVIVTEGTPLPPVSQVMHCNTCLAHVEMDRDDAIPVTTF